MCSFAEINRKKDSLKVFMAAKIASLLTTGQVDRHLSFRSQNPNDENFLILNKKMTPDQK